MENGLSKSVVKDSSTSKASLGKIIGIMFMSRTYAHMAHLATPSYAAHVALNGFYDDIIDLVHSERDIDDVVNYIMTKQQG
jgi:hypothetical protein